MTIQNAVEYLDRRAPCLSSNLCINGTRLVSLATTMGLQAISLLSTHNIPEASLISGMVKGAKGVSGQLISAMTVLGLPAKVLGFIVARKYVVLCHLFYQKPFKVFLHRLICSEVIPCTYELLRQFSFLPKAKTLYEMKIARVVLILHFVASASMKIASKWVGIREWRQIGYAEHELSSGCQNANFKIMRRIDGFLDRIGNTPNMTLPEFQILIKDVRFFLNASDLPDKWKKKIRQNIKQYFALQQDIMNGRLRDLTEQANTLTIITRGFSGYVISTVNQLSAALTREVCRLQSEVVALSAHLSPNAEFVTSQNGRAGSVVSAVPVLLPFAPPPLLPPLENLLNIAAAASNDVAPALAAFPRQDFQDLAPRSREDFQHLKDKLNENLRAFQQDLHADCYSYWDISLAVSHTAEVVFPLFGNTSRALPVISNALLIAKLSQKCLQDSWKINF